MSALDRFHIQPSDLQPGFKYRWLNYNERHIRDRVYNDGWEIPMFEKGENPLAVLPGQSTEAPAGGVIRQRGDVVLARMPIDRFNETIGAKIRAANERHNTSLDTMVAGANERMHRESRNAGLASHSKALVFREDSEQTS